MNMPNHRLKSSKRALDPGEWRIVSIWAEFFKKASGVLELGGGHETSFPQDWQKHV